MSGILYSSVRSITLGFLDLNFKILQSCSTVEIDSCFFSPFTFALTLSLLSFSTPLGVTLPDLSIVKVAEQIICWIPPAFVYSFVNFSSSSYSIYFYRSFEVRLFSYFFGFSSTGSSSNSSCISSSSS